MSIDKSSESLGGSVDRVLEAVDIRTSNADSNSPMLGIDNKLGFEAYIGTTTWQLHVDAVISRIADNEGSSGG